MALQPQGESDRVKRPVIAVSRNGLPPTLLQSLAAEADIRTWGATLAPTYDELVRLAAGADGLLCVPPDRIDDGFLDRLPRIKAVSNVAVGSDNLDLDALTKRGIPAGNTPGVLTETTADLAFLLILAAARRMKEAIAFVESDRWLNDGPFTALSVDVHEAKLGVVGFGRIGRAVARRARAFAMTVLYSSPHRATPEDEAATGATYVGLDGLLARSDIVTLHADLRPDNYHMIDDTKLALIRPGMSSSTRRAVDWSTQRRWRRPSVLDTYSRPGWT